MSEHDDDTDDTAAIGIYGDDPLHIMSTDPGDGSNYFRYERQTRECTCPRPRRRTLLVKHGAIPGDHECIEPRPGIDWPEVFAGLAVWRRR